MSASRSRDLAIAHAHDRGLGRGVPRRPHRRETGQPRVALPLSQGALAPRRARSFRGLGARPDLRGSQPQRQPFQRDGQGAVRQQPPLPPVPERAKAIRRQVAGDIQLGRVPHREDPWNGRHPLPRRLDVARPDGRGRDHSVLKEAVGSFVHRPIVARGGDRGTGRCPNTVAASMSRSVW